MAALLVSAGLTREAFAGSACLLNLQWQSSPDPGVAGYALYYGVSGTPLTNWMDVGNTTSFTVKDLIASSAYSFYVVAYDANQVESDPSNFVSYTAAAISSLQLGQIAGGSMSITFHVAPGGSCHVEYTDTLSPANWTVLATVVADSNGLVTISDPLVSSGASRYYRGVVP